MRLLIEINVAALSQSPHQLVLGDVIPGFGCSTQRGELLVVHGGLSPAQYAPERA